MMRIMCETNLISVIIRLKSVYYIWVDLVIPIQLIQASA